jgi:cobalt/nickel transport system permease protein
MHIPDGILNNTVSITSAVCTIPVVAYAYRQAKKELSDKIIPRSAGLAAFIFVAQLINFPIGLGTSGHLTGAFLLTYIIGPWLSILVLSLVLTIQAFIFQDGGIIVLPVNIMNMAIIGCLSSYLFLTLFSKRFADRLKGLHILRIIAGCIISLYCTSLLVSVQFWISGIMNFFTVLKILLLLNTLVGLIEGSITVLIIVFLEKVKFTRL